MSGVIHPSQSLPTYQNPSALDILHEFSLPSVIIWNPLLTHGLSIQCSACDQCVHLSFWNDGSLHYNSPRTIHDVKSHVLLVSAVYTCVNGHKLLAHDEKVLSKVMYTSIPFILLHRSGFTKDFVNFCYTFCQRGMNFQSLERAIAQLRWQHYDDRKKLYTEYASKCNEDEIQIPLFTEVAVKHLPSDDTLCQCFVTSFLKYEDLYRSFLQSIPVGEHLSVDHKYKIASNIGYLRNDQKWVSQYDSAFMVFNKDGKIVSWQFTKSSGFEQVKLLLQAVANRARTQGSEVKTMYIDNCCQWRKKLQEVFGEGCEVKLDVFHAVQRIVQKIPKKHPFYAPCARDMGMVFRDIHDKGQKRTKATPSSSSILANLNSFITRWEKVEFDGNRVLPVTAMAEINVLS